MSYMYIMGIKKWYFNIIILIFALAVCWPLCAYMLYRMIKDLNENNI